MGNYDSRILNLEKEVSTIRGDVSDIKDAVMLVSRSIEATTGMVKRVEEIVEPLHTEKMQREGVERYIKDIRQRRKDIIDKLKLPVLLVAAVGAVGTMASFIYKFIVE